MDDILALDDGREDERAFEVVKRVAQVNQQLYDRFASPVVKAMSNEPTVAQVTRAMTPARMERWLVSDANPATVATEGPGADRCAPAPAGGRGQPAAGRRARRSTRIEKTLDPYRDPRDEAQRANCSSRSTNRPGWPRR